MATSMSSTSTRSSCAVVGVGVLGTSLCRQILECADLADMTVTGITKTTKNHATIRQQVNINNNSDHRFHLTTADNCAADRFDNVVFCAPPSGFDDYAGAVKDAATKLWKGPLSSAGGGGGVFVFTSSGAVYGPGQGGGVVDESSPTADPNGNPRIAKLVDAEHAARTAGGTILRLAGLYTLDRGPHNYWLTSGNVIQAHPDGLINALHYDDAARACLAAILAGPRVCRGQTFLLSDAHPLTRAQICTAAMQAAKYQYFTPPVFADQDTVTTTTTTTFGQQPKPIQGKIYDGRRSNVVLQWQPQHESFEAHMRAHA